MCVCVYACVYACVCVCLCWCAGQTGRTRGMGRKTVSVMTFARNTRYIHSKTSTEIIYNLQIIFYCLFMSRSFIANLHIKICKSDTIRSCFWYSSSIYSIFEWMMNLVHKWHGFAVLCVSRALSITMMNKVYWSIFLQILYHHTVQSIVMKRGRTSIRKWLFFSVRVVNTTIIVELLLFLS